MLFAQFFASKWRWVAAALAIILAVLVLTQVQQYASARWARRKVAQQVEATDAARNARQLAEASRSHHFDSTVWVLAARAREVRHAANLQKQLDDSLSNLLPAVPVLPQRPARY